MANIPKPLGNVINYYTGTGPATHQIINRSWSGLSIINDSQDDLTFTVNNLQITVKANETFEDSFEDFNEITIDTATAYRVALRG